MSSEFARNSRKETMQRVRICERDIRKAQYLSSLQQMTKHIFHNYGPSEQRNLIIGAIPGLRHHGSFYTTSRRSGYAPI